jgi:hypothetical protein
MGFLGVGRVAITTQSHGDIACLRCPIKQGMIVIDFEKESGSNKSVA